MGLKFQVDSLEGLEDSVKGLYVEKDGKFTLGVEGIPQGEDVTGLKAQLETLLAETKEAKRLKREAEEKAEAERQEALRKSGNVEELEKSWNDKYAKREAELNGLLETERSSLTAQIRDLTVGRAATELASALAVQGSSAVLLPHIERRLDVELRDGKPTVVVRDKNGKPSAATLDELKAEIANDAAFAPLIAGSKANGGGVTGHQNGGGAAKGNIGGTKDERTAAIASKYPDLPLK